MNLSLKQQTVFEIILVLGTMLLIKDVADRFDVIGAGGIENILELKLLPHEQEMLNNTLEAVKQTVAETKL